MKEMEEQDNQMDNSDDKKEELNLNDLYTSLPTSVNKPKIDIQYPDKFYDEEGNEITGGKELAAAKHSYLQRRRVEAGVFVAGNFKYTEEMVLRFQEKIYNYFREHKDLLFIYEYWQECDPEDIDIPYETYCSDARNKYPTTKTMHQMIKNLIESRVTRAALNNTYNAYFARFLLQNRFGWKEKTESDINITQKKISFKFQNPELNDGNENNEDDIQEDQGFVPDFD